MVSLLKWQAIVAIVSSHCTQERLAYYMSPTVALDPWMSTLEEAEVVWRPTRPSRTNTLKRCPFHYRGLKCKSRKSRNTCNNGQIWPWSTKWSRAKANRVLPRECTGHNKHPLPTTQEKTLHMDNTRWSTPKSDWLYSLQPKMESSIQSAKTRPGADCGSDHEPLLPNSDLNWRKWGKPLDHSGMT